MDPPGAGPDGHAFLFAPFLGGLMFVLFLLLAGTLFYLVRSGRIAAPSWASGRPSPELEARRVLADRFARGDIGSDEFMERASVLNWTPGVEAAPTKRQAPAHQVTAGASASTLRPCALHAAPTSSPP